MYIYFFFFSSRRRHTRYWRDWSSDVCSSDLVGEVGPRLCFFENVGRHLSVGFEAVVSDLEGMGYRVAAGLFTAGVGRGAGRGKGEISGGAGSFKKKKK